MCPLERVAVALSERPEGNGGLSLPRRAVSAAGLPSGCWRRLQSTPMLRTWPAGNGASDGHREVANGSGSFLRFETVTPVGLRDDLALCISSWVSLTVAQGARV